MTGEPFDPQALGGRSGEAVRELRRRRADAIPHARGSLLSHLLGAHAILRAWRQPEHVLLAGLFHSVYSTESFAHRLFGPRDRARVREIVGPAAERLVFLFSAFGRSALLDAAETGAGERLSLPPRSRGPLLELERRELGDVLLMHAANVAEQVALPRGSPGRWLATASRLVAAARTDMPPPVLDGGTRTVTTEEEQALRAAYRGALAQRKLGTRAKALARAPVGEPLVVCALFALLARKGDDAAAFAERALATLSAWGVAWDKRLRVERWHEIASRLATDARAVGRDGDAILRRWEGALAAASGSPAKLWAYLDAQGVSPPARRELASATAALPATGDLPPRFAQYLGGLRANAERPMLHFYPGLRVEPWYDPATFPIVADLERLAPQIAAEAKQFDASSFQDEAEEIGREGRWGVLFFLEMGRRNEANLAKCPALRWILDHHRTLTTHAGLMYLSCLDPKSRVAPHYGPTNVRLRCHLGLEVPRGCGIRVGGITGRWEEGKCLVFDDSFRHDVWNESDARRIVLILDLWHPDLAEDEVALLAGLHRYGAANGASAERYWARNDAARRKANARKERGASDAPADEVRALDESTTAAMRAGDLRLASERAARYAQLCRGTRWYPVARDDDPVLPAAVPWSPVLTPAKLAHDIDQLEYLRERGLVGGELASVARRYDALLDTLRPLGENARVPLVGAALAQVGHAYNRLVYVRPTPRVERALSASWTAAKAEQEYLDGKPSCVVIDDFLSVEAIDSLRRFCLESTIWSTNRYDHGRLGSFFRDGFNCPLLVQIAEELRDAFPRVIGARRVTQIWGYKYATTQPALSPHADFAAVNVNFWITPTEANLEPDGGGLVVYDVEAPKDWDFPTYNRNGAKIRELLEERGARAIRIPYRYNRAVFFDSDLFHTTPALRFRSGYENRRINVTVLYGERHDS